MNVLTGKLKSLNKHMEANENETSQPKTFGMQQKQS